MPFNSQAQSQFPKPDWLLVYNTETEQIPAYGVMEIAGQDSSGRWQVQQPTVNGNRNVLFNGPVPIQPNSEGQAIRNSFMASYEPDNDDGAAPANNDIWGVKAGSWYLHKFYPGFRAVGEGVNGLAMVREDKQSRFWLVVTTGSASGSASGTTSSELEGGEFSAGGSASGSAESGSDQCATYSWSEVDWLGGCNYRVVNQGMSGTIKQFPAFETTGNLEVPPGVPIPAVVSPKGDCVFIFFPCCTAGIGPALALVTCVSLSTATNSASGTASGGPGSGGV